MTPDQIEIIAKAVVAELGLPMGIWAAIAVGCAMAGAYFGAYFKKTAEIDATDDRFEELQNQVKKTTQLTEDIKRSVNDRGWLAQQRWARKEEHYLSLLKMLSEYEYVMIRIHKQIELSGKISDDLMRQFSEVVPSIYTSHAISQLFVNQATSDLLVELIMMSGNKISGNREKDLEILDQRVTKAAMVRDAVIAQAKVDLACMDDSSPA